MPIPNSFEEIQANAGYMVYLPRLRYRADHSLQRLHAVGFEKVVLVEGVDGLKADPRALGASRGFLFDPGLAPGEMGCALSMIGLWEKVVDEDLPYMLVFEDDVLPHPDVARLGPRYWEETPPETDFVFLGNQFVAETLPDPSQRVVVSPAWCLHAYVITQEGARRALALLREQLSFDRWLPPIDMEVQYWMESGAIRYSCWNGTMLPSPYAFWDGGQHDGIGAPRDFVRSTRCTGLFFQNFSLGSAIWPGRSPLHGAPRRRRPKAVLISPLAPAKYGTGQALRAGATLDGLAMTCDVTLVLVPLYRNDPHADWIAERTERVFVLPATVADPFLRQLSRIVSEEDQRRARLSYPRPVVMTWSTAAAAASIVEFTGGQADLVYLMRSYLAPLAEPWLRSGQRPRVILDLDEYDPPALRQVAELCVQEGDLDGAAVAAADAEKLEPAIDGWIRAVDLVLAASDVELAYVRERLGEVRSRALPNPMPMRGGEGWAAPMDVLFVANFSYLPNVDGARWFCREVLPRLRQQMGREVRVTLAGSWIGRPVEELKGKGVIVVRHPHSVTPLYEATTIAVVPLRAGGGTRLKILEAFGHRRAVVSTTRGAEGLPIEPEHHMLTADDPAGFAEACARALTDGNLRQRLVSAAVDVAIAHAWPRVATMVSETVGAELQGRPLGKKPLISPAVTLPSLRVLDWRDEWMKT